MDASPTADHLLPAPEMAWIPEKVPAFDRIFEAALARGTGSTIDYHVDYLKYEFLCCLVERKNVLLHGTNNPAIARFEPRWQTDYIGRHITAVFAASDGIWPMFFAIIDRTRYRGSLRNACLRKKDATGQTRKHYYFSINVARLADRPWTTGTIYVLPRNSFQPVRGLDETPLEEWASSEPVEPIAKLAVSPEDFPFLGSVRGHDDRFSDYMETLLTTFQKVEELPDGYGFQYAWSAAWGQTVLAFIEELRAFAPTVTVEVLFEPEQGPAWLRLRGAAGFKDMLTKMLSDGARESPST